MPIPKGYKSPIYKYFANISFSALLTKLKVLKQLFTPKCAHHTLKK